MTISTLAEKYLTWCSRHRSPRTVDWYSGHLRGFVARAGDTLASSVKPFHIIEWADAHETWGDSYKRGAIMAVQRLFNWAAELGYINDSPVRRIRKPPAKCRDNPMSEENYKRILACLRPNDPFRDLLIFVWHTGARPQEARHVEARHAQIDNKRIVIPAAEAKGKRYTRVIYLHGEALEIIRRLVELYPDGKLFRNRRKGAWTKWSVCNRMHRLSKMTGKKHCLYDSRHGFGMRKLAEGHDHLVIGELMGHRDGSMLARIYGHMDRNVERLRKALEGSSPP